MTIIVTISLGRRLYGITLEMQHTNVVCGPDRSFNLRHVCVSGHNIQMAGE